MYKVTANINGETIVIPGNVIAAALKRIASVQGAGYRAEARHIESHKITERYAAPVDTSTPEAYFASQDAYNALHLEVRDALLN